MYFRVSCVLAASCLVWMIGASSPALSQSGDQRASERQRQQQPAADGKDAAKKSDDFAEVSRTLSGPAGNPECVWLGRRVVGLLWRDDLDTAFRHLDLYDRFGCPGAHIQASFRCVIRHGNLIDAKVPDSLNARVHGCWMNPNVQPPPPAAAAAPPGTTSQ